MRNLPALQVTTRGWQHESWNNGFYPDDLPEDWRLSFFANQFPAVLVASEDCKRLDVDTVVSWLDDLDENDFMFYFEQGIGGDVQTALGQHFGGIIGGNESSFKELQGSALPNSPESSILLSADNACCFCLYRPTAELTLVDLRKDIEALLDAAPTAKYCVLCWLSELPGPEVLENARVIAELLGA